MAVVIGGSNRNGTAHSVLLPIIGFYRMSQFKAFTPILNYTYNKRWECPTVLEVTSVCPPWLYARLFRLKFLESFVQVLRTYSWLPMAYAKTIYFSRCFGMAPMRFFSVSHFRENRRSAYLYAPSQSSVTTVRQLCPRVFHLWTYNCFPGLIELVSTILS